MENPVPFGSVDYLVCLFLLLFSRSMDMVSTRIATPKLHLEANPIARKMGWKWGIPFNVILCLALGLWPLPAVVVATTSLLVAARNFQHAWWMRAMGEHAYQQLVAHLMSRTPIGLFLTCLLGETIPFAMIGGATILFGHTHELYLAIGCGIVAYAAVVMFYTLLSLWRTRS